VRLRECVFPSREHGTAKQKEETKMKIKEKCKQGWLDTAAEWSAADFESAQRICEDCPLYATGERGSCPGIQNLKVL